MSEQEAGGSGRNLPEQERDDSGRFASTALTRKRDNAIAELGGPEAVYQMVEAGLPASKIAEELGLDGSDETARQSIYQFLERDPERYERAKETSVDALAEKAGEVYGEEAPTTSADAKWRNDRSGYYRWLAEVRGGFRQQDGVQISIGELHLDALRRAGSMDAAKRKSEPIEADFTVQPEEEDSGGVAGAQQQDAGSGVERPPNEEEPVRRELGERPDGV